MYNKWCSLAGALVCAVIMFMVSWWAALVTVIVVASLYAYLKYSKPGGVLSLCCVVLYCHRSGRPVRLPEIQQARWVKQSMCNITKLIKLEIRNQTGKRGKN